MLRVKHCVKKGIFIKYYLFIPFLSLIFFTSCGGTTDSYSNKKAAENPGLVLSSIIYNNDDMGETSEVETDVKNFSKAVGMLVYEKNLKKISTTSYQLTGEKLKERLSEEAERLFNDDSEDKKPFCNSVKYLEQKSTGFCSGFLIAPKLFITAGHCVSNKEIGFFRDSKTKSSYLENMRVVFNSSNNTLSKKNIYTIKQIKKFKNLGERGDYALLELSDEVKPNISVIPLLKEQLDMDDEIKKNDELMIIGHPYGLPMKISSNAKILQKSSSIFYADIDAFPGSSGSMVINKRTNKVVGLLVSGPTDKTLEDNLEWNSVDNCIKHKTYDEPSKNREQLSRVSKISNILIKDKDLTQTFFDTLMVLHKYYEEYKGGDSLFVKKAKDYSKLEKLYEKLDYDVDLEDEVGETPLYKAIELQNFEMFKFFLKNNSVTINRLFKGKPYALLVLETNNPEFIHYMLGLKIVDFKLKYQGQSLESYFNKLSK